MKIDYSEILKNFGQILNNEPEILAVFYEGSTATKTWDEFSDIDVCILVKDQDYEKIVKKLPEFLSWWGKINLINNYNGIDETYAYVNKDYLKVEINPIKKSELKPSWDLKNYRIEFDKTGTVPDILEKSKIEQKPLISHKEITWFFLDARNSFIYAARHYARGKKLSGASEIGNLGGQFFYYLGKIRGYEGYEFIRAAEKLLTKKEWGLLKISTCKSLKKSEFKRAIKANWKYMKYLENLYEKQTHKKLDLKCKDKELLNIINTALNKSS
ncbi:MAG: nucleotidyltransferase domain-containing protein [Candidatus Nanoarchaeia archaeon]|nr:nucleotidyltransferase domain-containing protein [Candidatus Nanoarchaeia archaeon]